MSKKRNILGVALLSLFVAYYSSITMFTHIHIVNGSTIVHSHPFADKNHTHTVDQVISIACLSLFQTLECVTEDGVEAILPEYGKITYDESIPAAVALQLPSVSLRAPPFSLS